MRAPVDTLVHMLTAAAAEGLPLNATPTHLRASGPCPHCLHEISPSEYTFEATTPWAPDHPLAQAPNGKGGLIVCFECLKPLWFTEPGKFQPMTRQFLRQLPATSQRFIKREQETFRRLQGARE